MMLALVAGLFEAASFSLLLPLTNAVAENSFDFLEQSRAFGWILALVPESIEGSDARDAFLVVVTVALISTQTYKIEAHQRPLGGSARRLPRVSRLTP
jgi:hypothetical protein